MTGGAKIRAVSLGVSHLALPQPGVHWPLTRDHSGGVAQSSVPIG